MAHPKRKISKTRRDSRRSHHALTPKTFTTCPCGNTVKYHHVCTVCGYYRGRQVLEVETVA